jgi:hypothetical protein
MSRFFTISFVSVLLFPAVRRNRRDFSDISIQASVVLYFRAVGHRLTPTDGQPELIACAALRLRKEYLDHIPTKED